MNNLQKPSGLTDAEWRQVLAQREGRNEDDERLAELIAQAEDRYARKRQDEIFGFDGAAFRRYWIPRYCVVLLAFAVLIALACIALQCSPH